MKHSKLSIFDALAYSFRSILDNFKFFFLTWFMLIAALLGAVLVAALINYSVIYETVSLVISYYQLPEGVIAYPGTYAYEHGGPLFAAIAENKMLTSITLVAFFAWMSAMYAGVIASMLEFYDKGFSNPTRIFSVLRQAPKFFLASLLLILVLTPAFCLLIVPGMYILLRLVFVFYFIADKDCGVIESFRLSWALTAQHVWSLLALACVQIVLNSAFDSTLYSGILGIQILIDSLTYVYIYRQLSGHSH